MQSSGTYAQKFFLQYIQHEPSQESASFTGILDDSGTDGLHNPPSRNTRTYRGVDIFKMFSIFGRKAIKLEKVNENPEANAAF